MLVITSTNGSNVDIYDLTAAVNLRGGDGIAGRCAFVDGVKNPTLHRGSHQTKYPV